MSAPDDAVPAAADDATATASAAAARAGVEVRELRSLQEMTQAAALVESIWSEPALPVHLQRAVAHAGSYLGGALRGGRVVGVAIAFLGLDGGQLRLHSHVAGVAEDERGREVGFALKLHQRAWALDRGVRRIGWTVDPLVRRNAYVNLTKLGAVASRYEVDFSGTMLDGVNGGDESDRLIIDWPIDTAAVAATVTGRPAPVDATALRGSGAVVVLEVGEDGGPVHPDPEAHGEGADAAVLLCRVPDDVVALRADPQRRAQARRWRVDLRDALTTAFGAGFAATGMSRDGWYVLTRDGRPPIDPTARTDRTSQTARTTTDGAPR